MPARRRVLLVVEGAKTEVGLFESMFAAYGFDADYEIYPYATNVHELCGRMFDGEEDPGGLSLLGVLKERAADADRALFDLDYSDVVLAFDFDPQDNRFDAEGLRRMQEHFSESTDEGKLYISYPMVEACKHFASFPDPGYMDRAVSLKQVKKYKRIVGDESGAQSFGRDFGREEFGFAIAAVAAKACVLSGCCGDPSDAADWYYSLDLGGVLDAEMDAMADKGEIQVLGTCLLFAADYSTEVVCLKDFVEKTFGGSAAGHEQTGDDGYPVDAPIVRQNAQDPEGE